MEQIGCTANVVLIDNNHLICANAGDCRCVVGELGKTITLSKDHSPLDNKERVRINKAGYHVNEEGRVKGLNVSRAIGYIKYKKNKQLNLKDQAITSLPDIK